MRKILTLLIAVSFSGCLRPAKLAPCDAYTRDTFYVHDTMRIRDTVIRYKIKYSRDSSVMSVNQTGGVTAWEVINN